MVPFRLSRVPFLLTRVPFYVEGFHLYLLDKGSIFMEKGSISMGQGSIFMAQDSTYMEKVPFYRSMVPCLQGNHTLLSPTTTARDLLLAPSTHVKFKIATLRLNNYSRGVILLWELQNDGSFSFTGFKPSPIFIRYVVSRWPDFPFT